ncbi:hypothetical protein GCM10009745_65970 [Kribbella yunnanensis]|uniref:Secreted protein n=1 Tax=Kribbella yunnanensis TaxID=190194 RepID=A0ABN2IPF8_9ACTN
MNRLLASAATLAALAAAAVIAPSQASASVQETCTDINYRGVAGTKIELWQCINAPGANGRIAYRAYIYDTFSTDVAIIRYRGGGELARARTSGFLGSALTTFFWGGSPTELQACAEISGHGFNCAWTKNDGNS